MVQYIIQIIAFQVFFLLVYDVFLKKETFFNWNRIYLIGTSLVSLILPFIKVTAFNEIVPKDYIVTLPEIFIGNKVEQTTQVVLPEIEIVNQGFSWSMETIFYLGLIVASLLFIFKIAHICLLIYKNPKRWKGNVLLVKLINSTSAFSFFHYVFLGSNLKEEEQKVIIKHELVHVTQKHTLDLLFFEVQRILFWFNPLVYMYQARIRSLHEYIADQEALKTQNKSDYYQNLLKQVFETQNVSFINAFFKKSLIKKRIMMLSKSKSKQVVKLKYALLIPLVFGMLMYTSADAQGTKKENIDLSQYSYSYKIADWDSKKLNKKSKKKYAFLKNNPNYVSWVLYDIKENKVSVSLHNVNEPIPEGYKSQETDVDGKKFVMYVKFINEEYLNKLTVNEDDKPIEQELVMIDEVEVPFAVIEQPPMFVDCESLPDEEQKKCTSEAISKYVQKNFNTNLAGDLGLTGRQMIRVVFKIDEKGNIIGVRSRAPHPKLEEEAVRVIKSLPKMIPGKHKGEAVIVPYSLPIIFQVAEKIDKKPKQQETVIIDKVEVIEEVEVPYAVIEQPPMFEGCETLSTAKEQRKCTSDSISKHVQKNFNTDLAGDLGLTGRQTIRTMFKISKEGNIVDVRVRASHPRLEEETKRVISALPKMIPGKHKGETVIVPYSLPIIFEVADKTDEKPSNSNNNKVEHEEVPFAVIDEMPIYPGCESITSRDELRKCTTDGISNFILNEFGKELPKNLDLLPRQKIYAMFKIDKTGYIESIRVRAKHPELEKEAIRVLKALPKMTPGKHKEVTVIVPYSVPIMYELGEKKN